MNKKILICVLILAIIGTLGTLLINIYMIDSTKKQIVELDDLKKIKDIDVVLILGCKAYSDRPSLMLEKRLEKGIEVYQNINTKLLLSGDHSNNNYDEVNIMRNYVLNFNIDANDLFLDYAGFTTYDSIYRAKYIFNAKKIIIVTQKYHMYRALYLSNKLDLEAYGIVADDVPQKLVMIKNKVREVFSRDKNFFKGLIKP